MFVKNVGVQIGENGLLRVRANPTDIVERVVENAQTLTLNVKKIAKVTTPNANG